MINTSEWLRPHINVDYPKSNKLIFEEWLYQQELPQTDREYLPIFWTSIWVNNDYGNEPVMRNKVQRYIDELDRSEKYWTAYQYDNGCLVDFKDLDIVTFGMSYRNESEKPTYNLPLIGQPFAAIHCGKKYKACFVGSITDPVREEMVQVLKGKEGYFISTHPMGELEYHQVLAESIFCLAPRGFGLPSFRSFEGMIHGAIPVYISDKFMSPFNLNWNEFGVLIEKDSISVIDEVLNSFTDYEIELKRKRISELNETHFNYEGCKNYIIDCLLSE
jgi:hypothetical protein